MFTDHQISRIRRVKLVIAEKMIKLRREDYIKTCNTRVCNYMFLAGGAITSLLQNEEPKDWDLYFKLPEPMADLAVNLNSYNDKIADIDEKYREVYGLDGKMITNKAITMKDGCSFITMQYGTPEQVKSTFDYVHTMCHYDLSEDKLYISPKQYDACVNKKLIVNNSSVLKVYRKEKFIQRGYKQC